MFTEAQNFSIVQTELDEVFFQEFAYDATEPQIATARSGDLFKPVTTTHAAYIGSVNMGVPLFALTGEVGNVSTVVPAVRNKYTILVNDYTQAIQISKDLFDDNMHGVWAEEVKDMALKARVTQDNLAFALFRNAFTTTLTPDGAAAISSSHTLINGGTTSNLATGALNATNLNLAIVKLRQQVDQRGVILGGSPSILLVPSALYKTAVEETESALTADTANNAVNIYSAKYSLKVMTSPYLDNVAGGSDTAWFLLTKNHAVRRLIRQDVETALTPWQYSTNRTYIYQANFRENYFISDYCGLVGSTG